MSSARSARWWPPSPSSALRDDREADVGARSWVFLVCISDLAAAAGGTTPAACRGPYFIGAPEAPRAPGAGGAGDMAVHRGGEGRDAVGVAKLSCLASRGQPASGH